MSAVAATLAASSVHTPSGRVVAGDDAFAELAFHLALAHGGRELMSQALAAVAAFARAQLGHQAIAALIRGGRDLAQNMVYWSCS